MAAVETPVLEVDHLQVDFLTRRGTVHAVRDVSFTIGKGETLGLVGESGSGKSVTAQALLGMIELPGRIVGGDVRWKGESLVHGNVAATIERIRGREIAMVFQDPMTSLDPVFTVGSQMVEVLRRHRKMSRKAAWSRSVELLDTVGIANPGQRVKQYPFEMSGGMRQRVLIAMALACEPELLVADEPTTALDVTIQAQILDLLADLQRRLGVAVLLITHDLGVVAGVCDRVAVMYAGKIVEDACAADLYAMPAHPYSIGPAAVDTASRHRARPSRRHHRGATGPTPATDRLRIRRALRTRCRSMPAAAADARTTGRQRGPPRGLLPCRRVARAHHKTRASRSGCAMTEVLAPTTLGRPVPTQERIIEADGVSVRFPVGRTGFWGQQTKWVHAVDDVSFTVHHGETLGLVGESGSGKTTVGRTVLRRIAPSAGRIIFHGEDVTTTSGEELRKLRRRMQLVFQDPYASLNPRMSVLQLVAEPLVVHGLVKSARAARDQVVALLERCGLPEDTADRHPHAFSGGQRQRIGIARALALQPDFIVADEPVSALDVSVRAQIVNLLQDLQREFGIAYLFIAHDLSVVRHISHRIAILYAGKLVELADSDAVYESPLHPYTEALLSSVPIPDPPIQRARQRIVLQGEIPNPIEPPPGCRFQTRCPLVQDVCRRETPPARREGTRPLGCLLRTLTLER